jgi:hypothetical protein
MTWTPRTRRRRRLAGALCAVLAWTAAAPERAQAQEPLTEVLEFLLTNHSVPTGDFVRDADAARVTTDTLTRLLLVELGTLPISTSSAGFVYRMNPTLGTLERASSSFGPFFSERSLTAGSRQASIGVSVSAARFTRLDDRSLRDGTLLTSGNQFRDEATPFDVETLSLELESRTLTVLGNVGLGDRVEVGIAVPFVSLSMSGARVNTYRDVSVQQASADARANGLGDVALRTKVRLTGAQASGVAATAEVRLPTGRRDDLLGAGKASVRGMLVASVEAGRLAAHVNGGMTAGGLADQQHYGGAVTFSASPRLTFIGEVLGRRLDGPGRLALERVAHPSIDGVDTLRLVATGSAVHSAMAVAGAKWNVTRTWVLSGNLTMPLTSGGLRPEPAIVLGLDYAFGR